MYMQTIDISALREQLSGDVYNPADSEFESARMAWNLAVDQRPVAVAFPLSAADIAATVRHAREHGLRVAPQATGHNAAPMGSLERTILLRTDRMRGVEIDAEARTARAEAGAQWIDVSGPASELGLAGLAGSAPDVGIVGYHLSGGLSLGLGRKHGLAVNSVVAVELVDAEGGLVRADHEHEPELFWALRGGGANFGIVTAIEFRLYPMATAYGGMLAWPLSEAERVLRAWRDFTATAPEEVTTSLRLMRMPPMPELPEVVRGRELVVIDGAYAGGAEEGARAIAALRELEPEIDTFASVPPVALSYIHMDPPEPVPGISGHMMLAALPDAAIDATLGVAGDGITSPLLMVEFRHLGGALGRAPAGAGALGHFRGEYAMFATGIPMDPVVSEAIEVNLAALAKVLAPFDAKAPYLNFAEHEVEVATAFEPETAARLAAARAVYDPAGLFQANHEIEAAQ